MECYRRTGQQFTAWLAEKELPGDTEAIDAPHIRAFLTAKTALAKSPDAKASGETPASLTAMSVVGRSGALAAVGAVGNGAGFLTCVTRSICYIAGTRDGGKRADIARSVNGGATWTAGAARPAHTFEWNAGLSCPTPRRCFSAFGSGLLETSDGFAHYRFQPVTKPSDGVDWVSCPTTQHCVADIFGGNNSKTFIYSDDGSPTCTVPAELWARTAALQGHLRCGAVVRGTSGAGGTGSTGSRSRCAPGH
jgi:hypothetical protein